MHEKDQRKQQVGDRTPSAARDPEPRRAAANAIVIEAVFAVMWFGWGQAAAPAWVSTTLAVGTVLALLVAGCGFVLAWRLRGRASLPAGSAARRRYGITVAIEFATTAVGSAILSASGHAEFVAVWVCFTVGVHFVPLSRVFPGIGMIGAAVALVSVALAALVIGLRTALAPSTVTGLGAGTCLLIHTIWLLVRAPPVRNDHDTRPPRIATMSDGIPRMPGHYPGQAVHRQWGVNGICQPV